MAAPKLTWDASAGRFRRGDGRFIPMSVVRAELDKALRISQNRMRALGDDLRAGRVSLDAWRLGMKAEIKSAHLMSSALARGGWDQLDPASFGRVGQIIRTEYQHLESWVSQIKSGWVLDGRLAARSALYVKDARETFHQAQREEMLKRGVDLELNVLSAVESCAQCIAEAAKGWVPVGTLSAPGSRTCLGNCRCHISFRKSEAA